MNHLTTIKNGEGSPEVDGLLHEYFQAEMPQPWPGFRLPRSYRTRVKASLPRRYSGRLALAACVALLVAGYLTLTGVFPQQEGATGVEPVQNIGSKEKGSRAKLPDAVEQRPELLPMDVQTPGKKAR